MVCLEKLIDHKKVIIGNAAAQPDFNPSNAEAILLCKAQIAAKIFENHLNLVMLVFVGKLSLSTLR